jgi:prepilin-type N-terminal cleavage/methylation domain-containing protein
MLRNRHKILFSKGFTIVELMVVVVVIGILATITIVSYGAWRQTATTNQMKSDLNTVAATMENYRTFNNTYQITAINNTTFTNFTPSPGDTLTGGSTDGINFCIDATNMQYTTLQWYIDNLSNTPTSGTCAGRTTVPIPTLPSGIAVTTAADTSLTFGWTSTSSYTVSYVLRCSLDPSFINGVVSTTVAYPATSGTISGLASNTGYYCEMNATDGAGTSAWSSYVTTATLTSAPAFPSAAGASTTTISYSFSAVANAVSYNVQLATNSTFTAGLVSSSQTATSGTFTGLTTSYQYYFRVQSVNSSGVGGPYTATLMPATYTNWGAYTKIASVGDWNGDGKNDVIGYKSTGLIELHLGNGNGTFGPAIVLVNIGSIVKDFVGPGTLPSGSAPVLFYDNTDGTGHTIVSNGSTGISNTLTTNVSGGWAACTAVFAAPKFYTGQTVIICESSALTEYSLSSSGVASLILTYGSGWAAAYGALVMGTGDFNGDNLGDVVGINSSNAMIFDPGTGTGTTGTTSTIGSSWVTNYISGGWDLTGDGKADILRLNTSTGYLGLYAGNGTAGFATTPAANTQIN